MPLRFRVAVTPVACLLLGAQTAPPQAPREVSIRTAPYTPPSAILRAEANLVETPLTVRDSRGRAAGGFQASDFEVLDNGVPRKIVSFTEIRKPGPASPAAARSPTPSVQPDSPVPPAQAKFVTFFFDDFHVANGNMLFVKKAAREFIAKGVKPGDRLSIVTASGQGDLDFTADAQRFADALERLAPHVRPVTTHYCGVSAIDSYIYLHNLDGQIREEAIGAAMKCANCDQGGGSAGGAAHTANADLQCRNKAISIATEAASTTWEQVYMASIDTLDGLSFAAKRLSEMKGARILVLTSAGFLLRPGVEDRLQSFIDYAVRANIVVHAIGAQGLEARMTGPKDMVRTSFYLDPLRNIANETGGRFFKDTNDLAGAMEQAADPEVTYTLAFNAGDPDGKFHTVKVRFATKRDGDLEFRPGYFSPDAKQQISARARMDDAVFTNETLREISTAVKLSAGQPRGGAIPVSVRYTVDVNTLRFTRFKGRHMQQIVFLTALLDPNGAFVTGEESIMELALTSEKLASLKKTGLTAVATILTAPGQFRVRTIVREGVKGSLAALATPVDVRGK